MQFVLVRTSTSSSRCSLGSATVPCNTYALPFPAVNPADTTSGSHEAPDPFSRSAPGGTGQPDGSGGPAQLPLNSRLSLAHQPAIVLWSAEPCRTLAVTTAYLLRTAIDVVNRGRPFGALPLDVGVVNPGRMPIIDASVAGRRPIFPARPRESGEHRRNVLVTTSRRNDVRRSRCHAPDARIDAIALQDLVAALEDGDHAEPRDAVSLFSRLTFVASPARDHRCSCANTDKLTVADLCQRAIVGLADGWL